MQMKPSDSRPIGVFDSGVGGLTVLRAIHEQLPQETSIYIGDLAHFPYGPKPRATVADRAIAIADFLAERDVKVIVIACNTATSAALDAITKAVDVPVIGVVKPGAMTAVEASSSKMIGVVATEGTVRSSSYARAVHEVCPEATVHQVACGVLVNMIEMGAVGSSDMRAVVDQVVEELADAKKCDTIILGCTHFPLIRDDFSQVSGTRATIVDSAGATAGALLQLLTERNMLTSGPARDHAFLVTDHAPSFVAQAKLLFGEHVNAARVDIGGPQEVEAGQIGGSS